MNIQIIVGSVREGRTALKVAQWAQTQINNQQLDNVDVEIVDLKEWALPFFAGANPPLTGIYDQPKQQEWAAQIAKGDAFIFISPEYNFGYSPALKNALDYLGKEWVGKPAAYVSYGATNGSRSIDQIRQIGTKMGMLDSHAIVEIRDIFSRNQAETFEGNEFDNRAIAAVLAKLQKYAA